MEHILTENREFRLRDQKGRRVGAQVSVWGKTDDDQGDMQYLVRVQATRDNEVYGASQPLETVNSFPEAMQVAEKKIKGAIKRYAKNSKIMEG